jgi:ribosome-associated translation inhibitor RaiA
LFITGTGIAIAAMTGGRTSMKKESGVQILGLNGDVTLYARVVEQMQRHLDRLGLRPARGRAAFSDENGPRGGRGTRCALTVSLPYRPPLHVARTATDQRRAFDDAMVALERELARYRERDRDHKRHPKKYFAAKRAAAVDAPSPPRRRRSS